MHLTMLLEMAADAFGDRTAYGHRGPGGLTYAELGDRARRVGTWASERGVERVGLVDVSSDVVPTLTFGSGYAGVPFVPVNYRLDDDKLRAILARTAPSVVVVDDPVPGRVGSIDGVELVLRADFLDQIAAVEPVDDAPLADPDEIAILLFTSGTTGEPKAAVLRHRHLTSYVIGTVEFMGADEDEAALVSVPPYHIAGISAVVTGVYAGRRVCYLPNFTPEAWVAQARDEAVTQAMVVPTMLGRILDVIERDHEHLPHLRHLSYGGGRMPVAVIERALSLLPHVDFVNAYGLTETSSTIAVLGPGGPPAGAGQRRPGDPAPARFGRPTAADARGRDPRRQRGRRWRRAPPARCSCAASRSPGSTSGAPTCWSTAGSPPATRGRSTRTGSSTSRAASTT